MLFFAAFIKHRKARKYHGNNAVKYIKAKCRFRCDVTDCVIIFIADVIFLFFLFDDVIIFVDVFPFTVVRVVQLCSFDSGDKCVCVT